jgi:O-antigen ligase
MPPAAALALAFVALPLAATGAVVWRRALLLSLPFLAALNGLAVPVGAASIRLDQLAACALVVPMAAALLTGTRRARTDPVVWWLAAILAANVVATVLHSPTPAYSLGQCGSLASVWVVYVLLVQFLDTRAELDAFVRRAAWAAALAGAVGVGAFLLAVVGLPVGGAEVSAAAVEHLTQAYGAYGTMVEPNILGSFSGAWLVFALSLLAAARASDLAPRTLRVVAAATAAALVLSFTRAAWLGALVGLGVFALGARRTLGVRLRAAGRSRRLAVPLAALGVVGAALWALPGGAGELFRFKLLNLVNLESQTGLLRLVTYGLAVQQTAAHPVVGWGTFTFAPLVAEGADFRQFENWRNLWIGNWLLLALHDTGVVGAALWVGMLTTALRRGLRAARALRDVDAALAARTLALTAAVASLLVPFLATTGFSLGWPWLLMGILGAHVRLAEDPGAVRVGPQMSQTSADALPHWQEEEHLRTSATSADTP